MHRLLVLASIVAAAAAADATPRPTAGSPSASADADQTAAIVPRPVNRRCPVSGDPIDRDVPVQVVQVQRDGKSVDVPVGLCCLDCLVAFRRDPQRFAAAALADRKAVAPAK